MIGAQQGLSLPPLTRTVGWILGINTAVFLVVEVMGLSSPGSVDKTFLWFGLVPSAVLHHGWLWQMVTYSVLHAGFAHYFFNMFALWMFGPDIEAVRGPRFFFELYFVGVIGAALFSLALSFSKVLGSPDIPSVGASGAIFAVLMAFAMLFGERKIIVIPLPLAIKAKYYVIILFVVMLVLTLRGHNGVANEAHLGGLVFGYLFVKFVPRRGMGFEMSEGLYAGRNFYHRWKRRRAAKKFQVYMREQGRDTTGYMDEKGNFLSPHDANDKKKDDRKDRGDWVN
ncbi:MAG TPA: rhomboid family intramembrane serine protease [Candidatus Angelobacter sp.]|nr:rhomboid family intramembrane serine protease [Candidatus Angelobacter sp.]